MLKKLFSIIAVSTILCCYSCKKDDKPSGAITGNWKFVSIHAETQSTAQYNDGTEDVKSVTISDYTSENNTGTVSFNGNTANSTGIGYDVTSTAKSYDYYNNVLSDSSEFPFTVNIPPSNSTATYQIIGQDSIVFSNGALGAQTTAGASASGGRFSIDGNILTLKSNIVQDTTMNLGGLIVTDHEFAAATLTLQRQ